MIENTFNDDLNVPIAFRKGTKACTKYFITKYVLYYKFFPI